MLKVIFCPATGLWAASLCHSLQGHFISHHYMIIICLIAAISGIVYAALLLYYRAAWGSIPGHHSGEINDAPAKAPVFVSLIIPARNESENITACLDAVMRQSYPRELFEVIVVDDHSEDDTATLVKAFADRNVQLISLSDHVSDRINSYKKKAIEIAVGGAKGELIVTTDADCLMPEDWLRTLADFYRRHDPAFIAAPVAIDCGPRFIEIFQALDFMTLQGITGAAVSKKQMTMCNGANMAYKRSAFYEVGGFAGIDHLASGDDMLLMHKIYRRYPAQVLFLKSPDAVVHTAPVRTVAAFFNQRIRWASKASGYDDKRILPVLLLVYLFNVLLLALPVIFLFGKEPLIIGSFQLPRFTFWLLLLLLKTIAELVFLYSVATFFRKRSLLWVFPLMQPFHILYTIIAGWLGKFGSYEWKKRKVK